MSDVWSVIGPATRLVAPALSRALRGYNSPLDQALAKCAQNAMVEAVSSLNSGGTIEEVREMAHAFALALVEVGAATSLVLPPNGESFTPAAGRAAWSSTISELLSQNAALDLSRIDPQLLVDRFAGSLWKQMRQEAREPESPLTNLVIQMTLDEILENRPARRAGKISNLYIRPVTQHFVGRDSLIRQAVPMLQEPSGSRVLVLTGQSGVGKSEIAAHLAGQMECQTIWWINAESIDTAATGYASLLVELEAESADDPIAAARTALSTRGGWAIVLDNVADERTANLLVPDTRSGGTVIATSLSAEWGTSFDREVVPPLSTHASIELLKRRGVDETPDLKEVASQLGGLPLALQQAAGFMATTGTSPRAYLSLLANRASDVLARGDVSTYGKSTTATFRLAAARARDFNSQAERLLRALALCGADAVPLQLLLPLFEDPMDLADATAAITRVSLAMPTAGGLSCHSLIRLMVLEESDTADPELVRNLMRGIAELSRDSPCTPSQVVSHLEALLTHSPASVDIVSACITAANLLRDRGHSSQAIHFAEVGVATARDQTAPSVDSAREEMKASVVLGRALMEGSVLARAHAVLGEAFARALRAREWQIAAATANDLAHLCTVRGELPAATDHFGRAARCLQKMDPGHEHDETRAVHLANRADFERHIGRPADAVKSLRDALELVETTEGLSPELATVNSNLCLALMDSGELELALAHAEAALEIDQATFGPNHPAVARDLNNLGLVLHDLGRLEEAEEAYQRCLSINSTTRGLDTSAAATATNNLARVLAARGNRPDAIAAFTDALKVQERINPDSADVAVTLVNRGGAFADDKNFGAAMADLKRALDIDRAVYGDLHLQIATDLNNIGRVLVEMGLLPAALKWLDRALGVANSVVGDRHVAYAYPLLTRALVYRAQGLHNQAAKDAEMAKDIFVSRLGSDHPASMQAAQRVIELKSGV